ncbi:MAG: tetratricopeptide repeat protein [Oligoflexia bacterium]|nr:tetratricopeptide repeat protein [Oligoflexia bacterium]
MKSKTFCVLISATLLTGCAGLTKSHQDNGTGSPAAVPQKTPEQKEKELQALLDSMNVKMQNLEARTNALNDKVDATRSVIDNLISSQQARTQGIQPQASDSAGTPVNPHLASSDPSAGFAADEAVQRYRKAMILFQSKSYADAILGFSAFVDRFPDHALAGSAQYYLAESYFAQGEMKLALREYQRVLTTYDRSPRVADTLERVAECEDRLQEHQEAAHHREQLLTLFPASPAAARAQSQSQSQSQPQPMKAAPAPEQTTEPEPKAASPTSGLDNPPPTAPSAPSSPAMEKSP